MPKVALLFLTSGELFHEPSWRQWFASAEGLVPALYARETACEQQDPRYWEAVQSYCSIKGLGSAITKQHLLSVYVHAPPAFKGASPSPESPLPLKQRCSGPRSPVAAPSKGPWAALVRRFLWGFNLVGARHPGEGQDRMGVLHAHRGGAVPALRGLQGPPE